MKRTELSRKARGQESKFSDQRGSAIVIALFVLALISVFAAYALSRSASEAVSIGNETAEARTLYAAQGSLEMMTRNFNKIFETKLNPTLSDRASVENGAVPGLQPDFAFTQTLDQITNSTPKQLSGGPYSGLYAIQDTWRLRTTATDNNSGSQIVLTRNVLNNRIPIFQFGIFYDDDLELFRPPRFSFGGRVHSNRHFFVSPGGEGVYFDSRVTATGHIITQTWRNGYTGDSSNNETWIKNATGTYKRLSPTMGSVLNGTPNVFASGKWANPDMPSSAINPNWATQSAVFDGNLQAQTKQLKLPLKVDDPSQSLITMVKRGKEVAGGSGGDLFANAAGVLGPVTSADADNGIKRSERFANKTGIRISLADSKAKLPGCASGSGTAAVTTPCGVRLDGEKTGLVPGPTPVPATTPDQARGYQPRAMTDGYLATRVNGERLYTGGGREVWIKVETVATDDTTGMLVTKDITEDILSLGLTEQLTNYDITYRTEDGGDYRELPPSSSLTATTAQAASLGTDSRAIIKIQRFGIPGPAIQGGSNVLNSYGSGSSAYNTVVRYSGADATKIQNGCSTGCTGVNTDPNSSLERMGHLKLATIGGTSTYAVVPFPIEMFDSREGLYYDQRSTTYYSTSAYGTLNSSSQKLSRNGGMSMIDIDVANLRRFLRGDFNGLFPTNTPFATTKGSGLRASWDPSATQDIPSREGWVVYLSDRRGDEDFDGQFDMEDVYGNAPGNDGVLQLGEDVNFDNILNIRVGFNGGNEAERYQDNTIFPDAAAVNDHKYYRRGVRLINGTVIPGIYDSATPANTRGFTFASENGVYVKGNYNATGVGTVPSTGNTPFNQYLPFNTATHVPASIVADAVTILSNAWMDGNSFRYPYDEGGRLADTTQMRFAMISGDTIASREDTPNQGGISPRLNGGVHNFKRFLERWTGERLDYAGSLINLFNSQNNNGSFKCCNTVYDPPTRNWVFDSTFLDPSRIPPGTPFFQYVQTTGFERSVE